jgi:hypothetical protein
VCAVACGQDAVEVRAKDENNPADYGQSELVAAANEVSAKPSSPAAYRVFAAKVEALKTQFSEAVAEEAERYLAFLALGPLESVAERSPAEQLEALALTVWPTAFGVPPQQGETPGAYLERICGNDHATLCKHMVPDYWPVMLGSLVWTRLKERAHVAYDTCGQCTGDPGYTSALSKYDDGQARWTALAGESEEISHPKSWPVAGPHAQPWSDPPLLSRDLDGKTFYDGEELRTGKCRRKVADRRGERTVLGVYVHPRDRVHTLHALLDDAAKAGYREVALLALAPKFPYAKREYRLAVGRRVKGRRLRVRRSNTIQVLVQALDAAAASADGPLRLN